MADSVPHLETAVLGGGCFWCMEAVFERLDGVLTVESGYAGGSRENPSYEQVCTGLTGHAETVRIGFDPKKVDYGLILDVFFRTHDPTTVDRQGADTGTQYRSIILYSDERQRNIAEAKIAAVDRSRVHPSRVVTRVEPLIRFWKAEDEHQHYYEKHPFAGYCRVVIAPKLLKAGLKAEPLD